jgi:hypothetical protein
VADSGYWSIANLTTVAATPELLIWPAASGRTGKPSASKSDGFAPPCSPS